jgi:outer membrane autotransporter protein
MRSETERPLATGSRGKDRSAARGIESVRIETIAAHDTVASALSPTHRLRTCVVRLVMAGAVTAASISPCVAQVINVGGGAGASAASGNGGGGGGDNGGGAGGSIGGTAGQAGTLNQGGAGAGATSCDTNHYLAGCGGLTGAMNSVITGNVTGGDGIAGAVGIAGGGGGAGAVFTSGDLALAPADTATMHGGKGGASGPAGGPGGGGAGVVFMGGTLVDIGNSITGGPGGDGSSGNPGGGGGVGLYFQGRTLTFNDAGAIHRIEGGFGGASGGSGGAGAVVATDGATITNISEGFQTGFQGGYGAAGAGSIPDGSGGDALDIVGSNNTFRNQGYVNPGASAGHAALAIGLHVSGNDNTIINASGGAIEGGWSTLDQSQTAPGGVAIRFDGNGNILELQNGYAVGGKVIAAGGGNTLALGGSADGTFDLTKIVSSLDNTNGFEQYQGFAVYEKTGLGTWTVTGSVGDSHPWAIEQGTLKLGSNGNLAAASNVNVDATLDVSGVAGSSATVQSLSGASTGTVATGNKTLVISNGQGGGAPVDPGNFGGNIAGAGSVEITGGKQVFSGVNTYQGGTLLNGGVLSISTDANLGTGGLAFNGGTLENTASLSSSRNVTLANGGGTFQTDSSLALSGTLSGNGGLTKTGSGTLTLTGAGTYAGPTTISAGTLAIGNGFDSTFVSAITNNGTLTFTDGAAFSYAGTINGGTGSNITQNGAGAVTLSGNSAAYAGTTTVNAGKLIVNGTLGGTVNVSAGALGGTGTLGGNTTIGSGALIGRQGDVLSFGGNLELSSNSNVDVSLGVADSSPGMFNVGGNLTLDGTLNVTDLGGFGPGLYRLFDYSGTLTNDGLQIGSVPAGVTPTNLSVQTSIASQVNLVNTGGAQLNYWDGGNAANHNNGAIDGGGGIWNSTNNNWTGSDGLVNGSWANGQFAIFAGQAGTVTVQDAAPGVVSVSGMQFATNGYLINGDAISLANAQSIIRVGTGGGAIATGITATIASALTGAGGLEKTDEGTLVLSGTNSYAGGTFVNGGTLSVSSDVNLGAAAGALTLDGGTLENTAAFGSARGVTLGAGGGQFKTDADLTLTNGVGGAGGLLKTGSGTLTLAADNSYTGGTEISAGTLQIGNGGKTGSISGAIDDDAKLVLNRSDTWTLASTIGGAGSLTQTGTGTAVLTGDSSYAGGTTIASGTLQLGNGGTSGSIAGDVVNHGALAFNRSDNVVFDGKISGAGNINQIGSGATDLTGDSSAFTGATTVSNGTLAVDGVLGGTLSVQSGGTLAGTGTVGTTTIAAGGTIAPGHSPGTLHVNGDITFDSGSTYSADIKPDQTGDLLASSGKATINGGTVQAVKAGGVYTPGSQWTIVSANSGVSGTFGALTQNMPFVDLSLAYDANHVYLDTARNQTSFCSVALTRNQCATGDGVESLGQGNTIYNAVASAPDDATARHALDALSGDVYATQKITMIDESRIFRDAALARMRASGDEAGIPASPIVAPVALWAQALGAWNQWNSDGNAATFNRSLGGLVLGADLPFAQNWRVGLMAGASNSRFDVSDRGAGGAIVSGNVAMYAGSQWGPIGLRFGVGYTWHDVDTHRTVDFPGFSDNLSSHYGAASVQGFGELGYRLGTPIVTLEPFVDLAAINLHTNGFTEQGGAAALTTPAGDTNVMFTTIGVRGEKAYTLYGWKTTTHATLGWRHAFGDTTPLSTFAFAGGNAFTIAGVPIARDAASVDAGIDVALSRAATFGVSYSGQFAKRSTDYGVQAKLTLAF